MAEKALAHAEFLKTLRHFRDNGTTAVERDLADIALTLYSLTDWHPPVVEFVNAQTLKSMDAGS